MGTLILCHGNICRSPLATALMRKYGYGDVICAGFKEGGLRSPKKVRDWAKIYREIDLEGHRSQQVTVDMLQEADLTLYMDGGQRQRLEKMWEEGGLAQSKGQIGQFVEPMGRYLSKPSDRIGDPMFQRGDTPEFTNIMLQLDDAASNFVKLRVVKKTADAA